MTEQPPKFEPEATTVPHNLTRDDKGWTTDCKFCDWDSDPAPHPDAPNYEALDHARIHHDFASGLYMTNAEMEFRRDQRRNVRRVVGSLSDQRATNAYEKGLGL